MAADNTTLGEFVLAGLPPAPRGVPKIEVTFDIDVNGILGVSTKDTATGKSQSIRITGSTRLAEDDKQRMIKDAERYAEEDRRRRDTADKLNAADAICYEEEALTVTIPVGVEEGMALRVPGHGLPSRDPGGTPGDLLVVVRSTPDARFERHGADLWRLAVVQVTDAILGTRLEVPTLDGHATVTVPPGTQPDTVLRLPHKGLPVFESPERGDLYLRVGVHIPEQLSAEERTLYERLRALKKT